MADKKISVSIQGNQITVAPDPLVMSSKDEVRWHGTGPRKFAIEFDQDPGFGRKLGHAKATAAQRPSRTGRYKYTVICEDDPNVRLDPIIIVEEPETGEG